MEASSQLLIRPLREGVNQSDVSRLDGGCDRVEIKVTEGCEVPERGSLGKRWHVIDHVVLALKRALSVSEWKELWLALSKAAPRNIVRVCCFVGYERPDNRQGSLADTA
jgi:hypothetical protein